MARSDLLIDLVDAEKRGDKQRFRVLVEAIIAEERAKQHHLVADRLSELITTVGSSELLTRDAGATRVADLVHEIVPNRRVDSLQLSPRPPTRRWVMVTGEPSNPRSSFPAGGRSTNDPHPASPAQPSSNRRSRSPVGRGSGARPPVPAATAHPPPTLAERATPPRSPAEPATRSCGARNTPRGVR